MKSWATEGYDRTTLLTDWNGTAVAETVAASCPNTIVITNSGGLNVLPFASNPNITAIIAAHYQGQEVGNSIVDVLWGDVNPSGKLPYTIALSEEDYSFAPITNSTALLETEDPNAWQSPFTEELLIDYRKCCSSSILQAASDTLQVTLTTTTSQSNLSSASVSRTPPSPWEVPQSPAWVAAASLLFLRTRRSCRAATRHYGRPYTASPSA